MKIICATADFAGCGYSRVILPAFYLADKCGHDVKVIDQITTEITKADAFWIQRQSNELWRNGDGQAFNSLSLCREIQRLGVKIVHEIDDDFWSIPSSNPASKVYNTGKKATKIMEEFCRIADLLIVSTDDLAERCSRLNSNIFVCKNALDGRHIPDLEITGEPKREGEIRIGWAGTATHNGDFAVCARPLAKIMREYPQVKLVWIGANMGHLFPRDLWSRIELVQPSVPNPTQDALNIGRYGDKLAPVKFYEILRGAEFDIAIAPLQHNTFNRCKSWIKVLEYGAAGIPVLAERFGPYKEYAECGAILTAYDDEREWYARLRDLIENASLRRDLARKNLDHVRDHHTMATAVEQWAEAFRSIDSPVLAN